MQNNVNDHKAVNNGDDILIGNQTREGQGGCCVDNHDAVIKLWEFIEMLTRNFTFSTSFFVGLKPKSPYHKITSYVHCLRKIVDFRLMNVQRTISKINSVKRIRA